MAEATAYEQWTDGAVRELARLAGELDVRTAADEPLARHTSMGVGGPTTLMLWPGSPARLRRLGAWMGGRRLPWRVLGGGSNLLISDEASAIPVVNMGAMTEGLEIGARSIRLPAGTPMARALRRSAEAGLDGLVWASGLPGSVGGAAAGNAGCWGGDMAACVARLELIDAHGEARALEPGEMNWSYRRLDLPSMLARPLTIVAVHLATTPADPSALKKRYLALQSRKRSQQPIGSRNSGCIFRNPEGPLTAGQLLEAAGCKGLRVGDAVVADVHANFIVNRGTARCAEVLSLITDMERKVLEHAGTRLRREIRQW